MTEDVKSTETAGSLLRSARQAAGVHISVLALRLKVPVSKIEGLENDHLEVFADPVFARTLAISACKQLRIDPAPILALLPKASPPRLRGDETNLNQRFFEGNSRRSRQGLLALKSPLVMAIPVLILAALLLYFWPVLFPAKTVAEEPVMPPNTPVQIEAPPEAGVESHPAMPAPITAPAEPAVPAVARPLPAPTAAPATAAAVAGVPLVFQASAVSWVQVSDAKGVVVFSKTLQPGESAQAQGQAPLKVVIGNASSTQVTVKNQAFDVQPFVVNNVAHFEIQP